MITKHFFLFALTFAIALGSCSQKPKTENLDKNSDTEEAPEPLPEEEIIIKKITVDSAAYFQKQLEIANGDTTGYWPIKTDVLPLDGAILPFKRIVAYYGNLYSQRMGALGEYPPKEMWQKLNAEVRAWEQADPSTAVQPAIHYIAAVAQGSPMSDGTYCKRMPDQQIDSALTIAKMGNAIVFLDLQVSLSSLQNEVPLLKKYLQMPHVHLGIDPEFSMKDGSIPGKRIGTMNADDINYCTEYLANLVKEYNLPPKILIVHRFTQGMLRNHKDIKLRPEVQVVIHMDGWGEPILKRSTYRLYIYKEPVQFTGFKIFYKNDLKKSPHVLMTPDDLLKLKPHPMYIQYQ